MVAAVAHRTQSLPDVLVDFVSVLRGKGLAVGTGETLDAAAAMQALEMTDRETLREGLAAVLMRREGDRQVFDEVFDLYFPAGPAGPEGASHPKRMLSLDQVRNSLVDAILARDATVVDTLAAAAVSELGELRTTDGHRRGWSAHQTLDRLDIAVVLTLARRASEEEPGTAAGRLWLPQAESLLRRFERQVNTDVRARLAQLRGRDRIANLAVRDDPAHRDFLTSDEADLAEMRRLVQPLARKLATALKVRARRARRGTVDMRSTMRKSLGTGGVPLNLVAQRKPPRHTRLLVLCDMSGSVAGFSGFTATLLRALQDQFRHLAVFGFINQMDEITSMLSDMGGMTETLALVHRQARLAVGHGNSDYGRALNDFVSNHLHTVGPRTTVLVLGDARSNHRPTNTDALHLIADRAQRTYWLNPERLALWGTGDSAAPEYATVAHMHECRNVHQLSRFVTRMLPG